jgi:hypothetical protein
MKAQIKLLTVSVFAAALIGCGDGAITTITTNDLMNPEHNYEVDTWGTNSEVYEFTPKSNSNKTCVFVMLDNSKAMGLQCFDKPVASQPNGAR